MARSSCPSRTYIARTRYGLLRRGVGPPLQHQGRLFVPSGAFGPLAHSSSTHMRMIQISKRFCWSWPESQGVCAIFVGAQLRSEGVWAFFWHSARVRGEEGIFWHSTRFRKGLGNFCCSPLGSGGFGAIFCLHSTRARLRLGIFGGT